MGGQVRNVMQHHVWRLEARAIPELMGKKRARAQRVPAS